MAQINTLISRQPPPLGLIAGEQLSDVWARDLKAHKDGRGSFTEYFSDEWNTCIKPVQWAVVKSLTGVFRGMHYHQRHDEGFAIVEGQALVGLVDLRNLSSETPAWSLYRFNAATPTLLTFPRGIAHGWYFEQDSIHLQPVSESYSTYGIDDNNGCAWNDPELPIEWPFSDANLSTRASGFGSFADLVSLARAEKNLNLL